MPYRKGMARDRVRLGLYTLIGFALVGWVASPFSPLKRMVGHQPDGGFVVSTGQQILPGTIAFDQRLSDIALRPDGKILAVVAKSKVFLVKGAAMIPDTDIDLGASAGFHGVAWAQDGSRLFVSLENGFLLALRYSNERLTLDSKIDLRRPGDKTNPVPGGLCVTHDSAKAYVACASLNAVVEVDLQANKRTREFATQNIPFTAKLTPDESELIVSNWGGEPPKSGDLRDLSVDQEVKVNQEGSAATGTVSLIPISGGQTTVVPVGIHPTGIAVAGQRAYVANAMSDSISEIDLTTKRVSRTIEFRFQGRRIIGAMPNELAVRNDRLYSCNGGDNALCEIDLKKGVVAGYRPAGFYPTGVRVTPDGLTAYVVNTKGNGSVKNALKGSKYRNTHDFQGTVSVLDLSSDLSADSDKVAELDSWNEPERAYQSDLKVYHGAIKHVIYIIKENHTYDDIFGDMPEGDGEPSLCSLGETVMPNHRKIARTFGLFDNAYTCGTNSADGHQWCDQAMANEYLEHFYVGYSRTYPDDGEDAMALNSTGRIWDAAIKAHKSVRVYGEWAGDSQATYEPRPPKDWFEAWDDRQSGRNLFHYKAHTRVNSLKPILCPDYHYWPLIQSDQSRVDVFEKEFKSYLSQGKLPNLMVMSLPSDHSEGANPAYPTPRSMMADNDLALGRIVDLVSHSQAWKDTCIFVTEDDSQSGPDHVDGHRTLCLVVSPYSRRGVVNSGFATQLTILKSIETMLGIKPMTKFDTIARPFTECFTDAPDMTPYDVAKNNVPLGEHNPSRDKLSAEGKYWYDISASLDWSSMDRADFYWLNRIVWYSIYKGSRPYPGRPGEQPGQIDTDD